MGQLVSKCLLWSVSAASTLVFVLLVRTFGLTSRDTDSPAYKSREEDFIPADDERVRRFVHALRCMTVSMEEHVQNHSELSRLRQFIVSSFPTIHSNALVTVEKIAKYSSLYSISGSDASLTPYLLMAHLDVVPVTSEEWEEPPFAGNIKDNYIYGRGAVDMKQTLFGILEALEFLLKRGHQPKRSFYIAFGHDEEVGGVEGAYNIGQTMASRNVKLEFILDEGLPVTDGIVPGTEVPVAIIGTSEKGSLTMKLHVNSPGGHASMPHPQSSIGILSAALARLEANPHPSVFGNGPERPFFEYVAPKMKLPMRIVMSNLWLFSPLVVKMLSRKPETNAMLRTTTAITQFNAGVKDNVIVPRATATVNHRIHPAQTVEEVLAYDKKIINDERVSFEIGPHFEPPPNSPFSTDCFGYQMVRASILQVWGYKNVTVAPGLLMGNTDTRHYTSLTSNIYRFSPTYMYPGDVARVHGVNERISLKNYEEAINFYLQVMLNADRSMLHASSAQPH
ncbi:N-fatty-acyl-amino acid synthase/hydrolase PM20D1.2 [Lamellibrachia satsuma]|nr:N-fatty-acyl-amino acid synthase/hydrolase PM20D1.2 [Lamellibrachia satsuma]